MHSAVSTVFAIDAACSSAERVTIVGSITPASNRSQYAPVRGVEALARAEAAHASTTTGRLEAGVAGDPAQRLLQRAADDRGACRLVGLEAGGVDRRLRVQERDAAAGEDALGARRARRLHGVLDAVPALAQLGLGRARRP